MTGTKHHLFWMLTGALLFGIGLFAFGAITPPAITMPDDGSQSPVAVQGAVSIIDAQANITLTNLEQQFVSLYNHVNPAVVSIQVTEELGFGEGSGFVAAFTLQEGYRVIGVGAWLGTIMLFNVWGLIWPNQKKILGIVQASPEEIAKGKVVALMASRTNTLLSVPMVLAMTSQGHGLPY